jgi:hypothetical protein
MSNLLTCASLPTGVRTMAMLGRYRRRIATAALSALVATRLPALMQLLLDSPATLTRVASLVVMVGTCVATTAWPELLRTTLDVFLQAVRCITRTTATSCCCCMAVCSTKLCAACDFTPHTETNSAACHPHLISYTHRPSWMTPSSAATSLTWTRSTSRSVYQEAWINDAQHMNHLHLLAIGLRSPCSTMSTITDYDLTEQNIYHDLTDQNIAQNLTVPNIHLQADLCEDSVLARRLALTRADLVRSMSILDAARGLLATLAAALAPPGSPAGAPAGPGGAQMPPPAGGSVTYWVNLSILGR